MLDMNKPTQSFDFYYDILDINGTLCIHSKFSKCKTVIQYREAISYYMEYVQRKEMPKEYFLIIDFQNINISKIMWTLFNNAKKETTRHATYTTVYGLKNFSKLLWMGLITSIGYGNRFFMSNGFESSINWLKEKSK